MGTLITEDQNLSVFLMSLISLAINFQYQLNLIKRQIFNIFSVVRTVNDHFVNIRYAIFIGNHPHFPTRLIPIAFPANAPNLRRGYAFISFAKRTTLYSLFILLGPVGPAGRNHDPSFSVYIRYKFGHTIKFTTINVLFTMSGL